MKTELAPTSSDLSLLPRADLPVIWDEFRAKAEQLRETANTLVVSSVEEKDKMELARTTRMRKCECEQCGFLVRLTQKWLDVGQPICPTPGHGSMKADLPKGEEEGE